MGRFWLGVGILVGLFVLGIWVEKTTETTHVQIAGYLDRAADSQDPAQAYTLVTRAKEAWQAGHAAIAAVSDHAPMDEIDGLFDQMEVCHRNGKMGDFSAFCARAAEQIRALYQAHSLTWWNLL